MKKLVMLTFLTYLLLISCEKQKELECDSNLFPMRDVFQIFEQDSNIYDRITMDFRGHEIIFKANENGNLCTIGYQQDELFNGNTLIEIFDEEENLLEEIDYRFSSTEYEYVIFPKIQIEKGRKYRIKRTIIEELTAAERIGRVLRPYDFFEDNNPFLLPIEVNGMELIETNFYSGDKINGTYTNLSVPMIDFGLSEE